MLALHVPRLCVVNNESWRRAVEDYGVIYLGSAIFKIARLLFIALFSVHFFACVFFRVKVVSAVSPEHVTEFYSSKNVASNVSVLNSNQFKFKAKAILSSKF